MQNVVADLAAAGFKEQPTISTLAMRSRAESPRVPAVAYCQGTPLRGEIDARTVRTQFAFAPVHGKAMP